MLVNRLVEFVLLNQGTWLFGTSVLIVVKQMVFSLLLAVIFTYVTGNCEGTSLFIIISIQ